MHRNAKFAFLALGALFLTPCAIAKPATPSLKVFLEGQRSANHIPGLAIAVVSKGKLVEEQEAGFATLDWNQPVGPTTRFQLASVTKLFTGLLVMRLVDAGKLDLERPVATYIPEAPASWSKISVRMLANHSSGIPESPDGEAPATVFELLTSLRDKPLDWVPGTQSRYGLNDFTILGLVIERATGKPFETALRDFLLHPLGLKDTGYSHLRQDGPVRTASLLERRAVVYDWAKGQQSYEFLYPERAYPAGGLYSSIADMAKLLGALETGKIVSRARLNELTTAADLGGGKHGEFGVGWIVRTHQGQSVAGHSGGPALADVLYYPDRKFAVVVLQNQHKLYPWLAGAVADRFIGVPEDLGAADQAPAMTNKVLEVLRRPMATTALGRTWSTDAIANFVPWLQTDGAVLLQSLGTPRNAILVGDRQTGDGRERTYSVRFANATMRWTATTNADGLLEALAPANQ